MIVYRLTNHRVLDGEGAARQLSNRWNSPGTRMVYCSGSIALAKGEISRRTPLNLLPPGFEILHIKIPDDLILKPYSFPENWDDVPPSADSKREGDQFVKEGKYLAMRVPSVYDKGSFNYLLNPLHRAFDQAQVVKVEELYL